MLKIIQLQTLPGSGKLYAGDDIEELAALSEKGEAVLFVCDNVKNAPFDGRIKYVAENLASCSTEYFETVYSRQKNIPLTVCVTERTVIREITVGDLTGLYEIYDDDEVRRYMEPLYEYEEEKKYTENYINNMYEVYGYGMWLVTDRHTGEPVGRAGYGIRNIDGEYYHELGYVIKREYRQKGLAYEVCGNILRYGREKYEIINPIIVTEEKNIPSRRLALKLGFREAGRTEMNEKEYVIYQI